MYNYDKILRLLFKCRLDDKKCKSIEKKYPHINSSSGATTISSVLGWGQENGLIKKHDVVLVPHEAGEYAGAVIQGDPFTTKCYDRYMSWYKILGKLIVESCGKYWIPIILFSFIQFILYSILPVIWAWFL